MTLLHFNKATRASRLSGRIVPVSTYVDQSVAPFKKNAHFAILRPKEYHL